MRTNLPPVTFKLMLPDEASRRMTFDDVPEKEALDKILGWPAGDSPPVFIYRDSEGDVILIKNSQDVAEAVRDARKTGAPSIKLRLHRSDRSRCGPCHKEHTKTKGACRRPGATTSASRRPHPWIFGAFGHPALWGGADPCELKVGLDEWRRVMKGVDTVFDELFGTHQSEGADATEQSKVQTEPGSKEGITNVQPNDTNEDAVAAEGATKESDIGKVNDGANEVDTTHAAEAKPEAGFIMAEGAAKTAVKNTSAGDEAEAKLEPEPKPEVETETKEAKNIRAAQASEEASSFDSTDERAVSIKVKLLEEMGFNIPTSIAENLIKELGGRMDLIVRALVANSK